MRGVRGLRVVAALGAAVAVALLAAAAPADDLTFRPTVIVRRGNGQGSGTVIASVAGETLVLTAAHVVRDVGPITVELHRYNLGVERSVPAAGWPVRLPAEVAAADSSADVAVVRIRGRPALPFVARLGAPGDEPQRGGAVVSVGVDGGDHLGSWPTRVRSVVWFVLASDARDEHAMHLLRLAEAREAESPHPAPSPALAAFNEHERPFLVTERAPEHGRSGGGLFLGGEGGRHALVGVCVGRIEVSRGKTVGLFASGESVRRLLRVHDLDTVVARSEAERDRPTVTPTRARTDRKAPRTTDP